MTGLRLGALCWNQYARWQELLDAGRRADLLGYDTLWTWDHVYPIVGDSHGPIFEGYMTLAAWAQATSRIRLGLMVAANTFREPALTAKMVTTLDHISGGRAILGIGAAWNEEEHRTYGVPFGSGFPERLRWLGEALPIIRSMLDGEPATTGGARYATDQARNDPLPVQAHLPILIGGGGERVTLRLVARYGDACNLGGGPDIVQRKEAILLQHCEAEGRDPAEIERTASIGVVVIRDSEQEARRFLDTILERNGGAPRERLGNDPSLGTPEQVAERVAPLLALGYRHLIAHIPAPYDDETMARLATEVRALLEA